MSNDLNTIITKIKLYDTNLKKSITIKIPRSLNNKTISELKDHYDTETCKIYWWATQTTQN